jgi:hypothetical protein
MPEWSSDPPTYDLSHGASPFGGSEYFTASISMTSGVKNANSWNVSSLRARVRAPF